MSRFTLHKRRLFSRYYILLFFCAPLLLGFILPGTAKGSFTIEDEKKLGKEFYDKLQKGNLLLQNERANGYLALWVSEFWPTVK
jgi:hypothetical protein